MDIWKVLGILPTRDKNAIKAAYHEQLTQVHPEEKPEEFKALRAAYEQALQEAEAASARQEPQKDESPLGLWAARAQGLYDDFARRIDPQQWQELCQDEVCFSLASRAAARDKLLHIFMEDYYLPHLVWQELDAFFGILNDLEELKEQYPPAFIERVVEPGIRYDDYVRYEWFSECHDRTPDEYLHKYFKAEELIRSGDEAEAAGALAALRELPVTHPFTELLQSRLLLRQEKYEQARELAEATLALHPESGYLLLIAADAARLAGQVNRALELYDQLLAAEPKHNGAIYGRAQALALLGRWEDATDAYDKLIAQFPSDRNLRDRQRQVYADWAAQLENTMEADPENRKARMDLAWCCLELEQFQKGLQVLDGFDPRDLTERYEYESTCGNLCLALEQNERALEHARGWEQAMRDIPEDTEDEKLREKKGRISRSFEMQAAALAGLQRLDEALERLEEAKALDPTQPRIWRNQCQWLLAAKRFEAVYEPAQKLCELLPGDAIGWYYLGLAQFENLDYRESYDSFCQALERDGSTLDFYLYKIRVLLIYKKWDDAKEQLNYLAEHGVNCDATTFLRARLDQLCGGKEKEADAYAVFQALLTKPDLDLYFKEQLYFAASFDDTLTRAQQLELAEKGLAWRPHDFDLQGRAVWLYNELEQFDKAIELAERSLKAYPGVVNQIYRLAYAYYKTRQYAKAAPLYEQNAATQEDQEDWYLAGRYYYYANQPEKAKECLEKAARMDEKDAYTLRFLSLLARDAGDGDQAVLYARQAVNAEQEKERVRWHWQHLATLLDHLNRTAEACEAWMQVAALTGELGKYCSADAVWEKTQQWDKAFSARHDYFSDSAHQEPKDRDGYWVEQAWLRLRQGDVEGMGQALRKLPKRNQAEEYYQVMACYCLALGDNKKAFKWWQRIESASVRQQGIYRMMLHDLGRTGELSEVNEAYARRRGQDDGGEMPLALSSQASAAAFGRQPEKALELLKQIGDWPLCEHCSYDHCRDGAMARAEVLELGGDYAAALAILQEEYRRSADDESVVLGILRLKRKMNR
ncbi:hypothetical protein CE91St44_00850 [Oscillospiraceae bacterium]|nr:hypothetical protein CE91St44_00850 [Oscillospiraceae bacterium]